MTLLNDIREWTETLSPWLQDAARRLFQNEGQLIDTDYAELYSLLKAHYGLDCPEGLVAIPFGTDHLPAELPAGEHIVVKAVRNLTHVNRIRADQRLAFAGQGITVIYGGNGSGKSGYARVIKRACRARDQAEPVLPNATDLTENGEVPTAIFEIEIGGRVEDVAWNRDAKSSDILSAITVFDSKCARSYLTTEHEVAYLPYGLDIVEGLANQVLPKLSSLLDAELKTLDVDIRPFSHLIGDTEVGRLIRDLSSTIDTFALTDLGMLSENELSRHAFIERALAQPNPANRAIELETSVERLKAYAATLMSAVKWVSGDAIAKLADLDREVCDAELVEKGASDALQAGDKLLAGTGSRVWKVLFEAARKFSVEEAYPGQDFPATLEGQPCPLCQDPLSADAGNRLHRFDAYVRNDVARTAELARETLREARVKIEGAQFTGALEASERELTHLDDRLPAMVAVFIDSIEHRRQWMIDRLAIHDWSGHPKIADSPVTLIRSYAARQLREKRALMRAADEAARVKLQIEYAELDARKNLNAILPSVLDCISLMRKKATLESCREALRTRPISDKSKEFVSSAVTSELQLALEAEFTSLGIAHIRTRLKERARQGQMLHQLILAVPTAHKIEDILSEGEQRTIALGSFLAELSLANHSCGIVFDDPVSSLDHKHRLRVTRRLISESSRRQVIIFTHDAVFLQQLQAECLEQGIAPSICWLEWEGPHSGIVREGLPWAHQTIPARLDSLGKKCREFARLPWPPEPSEALGSQMIQQYSFLRATIERVVQDNILNGTIQRFQEYIDVRKLEGVVGLDREEVGETLRLMRRCHGIVQAHDPASARDEPAPTPEDLMRDIADLEALVQRINDRKRSARETSARSG